jgi:nicotinic acid phosphoribosyltransferase
MHPILKTDHYKLTMAEAGWPLRSETFYYSHRKGGPHLLPFDVKEAIAKLNPFSKLHGTYEERQWLERQNGTPLGAWFHGLKKEHFFFDVQSPPAGSWLCDRDPMFVVSGYSFAVSWLEPLVLQWNYAIQIATLAATDPSQLLEEVEEVTCESQKQLILKTLDRVRELGYHVPDAKIHVSAAQYGGHVYDKVHSLIEAVGDSSRIFEVGMRGSSCEKQHEVALMAAREAGLKATSNVCAANFLGLKSVGTMGHEHVQRYGSDEAAYRAMVERVPGSVFFLLDTFDTLKSGIPTAFKIIAEQPERQHAVRFDSGDIRSQFIFAVRLAKKMGIKPRFCLEDGWNLQKTVEFEALRKELGLPPEQVLYGYGGHIVNSPFTKLTRDRVSAVWKLTQTRDTPTMKFGDAGTKGKGKESIPGKPVLYTTEYGTTVAQRGEELSMADECRNAYESDEPLPNPYEKDSPYKFYSGTYSPGTKALVKSLTHKRNRVIEEIENAS